MSFGIGHLHLRKNVGTYLGQSFDAEIRKQQTAALKAQLRTGMGALKRQISGAQSDAIARYHQRPRSPQLGDYVQSVGRRLDKHADSIERGLGYVRPGLQLARRGMNKASTTYRGRIAPQLGDLRGQIRAKASQWQESLGESFRAYCTEEAPRGRSWGYEGYY